MTMWQGGAYVLFIIVWSIVVNKYYQRKLVREQEEYRDKLKEDLRRALS